MVLPSYREGISRVLLEACSLKRPIVTTNTTGCRDIVTDGLNGYLCEAKDTRSLTDALKKMICCSEAERTRMGESGRMLALEKYDQRIISSIDLSELITL